MPKPRLLPLDTSTMLVVHDAIGWRFVCHEQRLATHSFTTEAALQRHATRFDRSATALATYRLRYEGLYG